MVVAALLLGRAVFRLVEAALVVAPLVDEAFADAALVDEDLLDPVRERAGCAGAGRDFTEAFFRLAIHLLHRRDGSEGGECVATRHSRD